MSYGRVNGTGEQPRFEIVLSEQRRGAGAHAGGPSSASDRKLFVGSPAHGGKRHGRDARADGERMERRSTVPSIRRTVKHSKPLCSP